MSIKAWGAIGGSVSAITFRLMKDKLGGGWALGFLGFLIVAFVALCFVEKRQMRRLRARISKLGPEQKERFIQEFDPKIQANLRRNEK